MTGLNTEPAVASKRTSPLKGRDIRLYTTGQILRNPASDHLFWRDARL